MADLAPDGRARLAGKRGTDIGEVRGEGAIFLRETKRRAACPERKLAFNSGEGGSGKKGARRFCRKRAARRKRMSACGRGISAEKSESLYRRSGREQSGKPQYAAAATAGEGAQVSTERTKPPFGRRFYEKQNPDRSGFRIGIGWPASPRF